MLKPIIINHTNPLLENYQSLNQEKPKEYAGFIYLWKCLPEDMFYIGCHKGVYHDQYRGSGSKFKQVFDYYGVTQFDRVILEYVSSEDQLKAREQHWMDKFNAVKSARFYNQKNTIRR